MKKPIIKPVVLGIVFLCSLIFFSIVTNRKNEDLTTSMSEATLPVLYFFYNDTQINEMHGYVTEMNDASMRDSLTPISNERKLPFLVNTYGNEIDSLFYEIRTIEENRLVADGEISEFEEKGESISSTIEVQNLLTKEEEYLMRIELRMEEDTLYYYTRLMQTESCYAKECIEFATKFHDYTFRMDAGTFIPQYMDPATGDATTLSYVDLTCTMKQVTWADFTPQKLTNPVVSFKEINSSYNVLTIDYVVTKVNEEGESEFFNVEEYYRLRFVEDKMYILNFERRMNQILQIENGILNDRTSIQLGIRDLDVNYKSSETGDLVAFVQEGDLWSFNRTENELIQVFSFRGNEGIDARENWNQHDIQIIKVDEVGSVDFVVYGYMNRGNHEGEVGISVNHFDGVSYTVEEELFIPVTKSYEVLQAEIGQLIYENDMEMVYLMFEGDVYCIHLDTLEVETIISDLETGCYATSPSHRYFAYVETKNQYQSEAITLMDLRNGSIREINADEGCYAKPLGFIDEDFIYGNAEKSAVESDAAGHTYFPMKYLKFLNTSEDETDVIKEYSPSGGIIESIEIGDYSIIVKLMKKDGNRFVEAGEDSIMNHVADTEAFVWVKTTATDIKQTQVQIALKNEISARRTKKSVSKEILLEEPKILELESDSAHEYFYVYKKGEVILATEDISDAIALANEEEGIVVDSDMNYVWLKARKTWQGAFSSISPSESDAGADSTTQCISAILVYEDKACNVTDLVRAGKTSKQILNENLSGHTVLDITGCNAEEILFYVSNNNPVLAMIDDQNAVLVIGYSKTHISYFDPSTQSITSVTYEAADEMFANGSNRFLTYL